MKILVLGLPGSGKSTQVDKLVEYLKVPALKMGAILRHIVSDPENELGQQIKQVMLDGHLVKDEIVEEIIRKECQKQPNGFVMEGYPRTIHQINHFDPGFDKVFYLKLDPAMAHERMMGRAREDDNKEAIKNRFNEQMKDLDKILEHYRPVLTEVEANAGIEEIFSQLVENLPKKA